MPLAMDTPDLETLHVGLVVHHIGDGPQYRMNQNSFPGNWPRGAELCIQCMARWNELKQECDSKGRTLSIQRLCAAPERLPTCLAYATVGMSMANAKRTGECYDGDRS